MNRWKWIPGYEGSFKAHSKGKFKRTRNIVISRKCGKEGLYPRRIVFPKGPIKLSKGKVYPRVRLTTEKSSKLWKAHHLILITFQGPCPEGKEARHLDDDPSNLRNSNLKWGTRKQNMRDASRNGKLTGGRGGFKLNRKKAEKVRRLFKTGNYTKKQLGDLFGVTYYTIIEITKGRTWT